MVMAGSLDYEQTLAHVIDLVVPEIADWCGVYIADAGDGEEREITSRHADPEIEAMLVEVRRRRRDGSGGSESLQVLRTGESILASDITGRAASDMDERQRATAERLGARSYMIVPLRARVRVIGALTLLSTRPGRHYNEQDLAFAETLAQRFALAIDNARLYEEAERALDLLDTVFATAPVGLAFLDVEQRYVRVNPALAALNGPRVEAHLGRRVGDVPGRLASALAALHREAVESSEPPPGREGTGGPPDGGGRHWTASGPSNHVPNDEGIRAGVTVKGLTPRRPAPEPAP